MYTGVGRGGFIKDVLRKTKEQITIIIIIIIISKIL
jgi:hypothetical protein